MSTKTQNQNSLSTANQTGRLPDPRVRIIDQDQAGKCLNTGWWSGGASGFHLFSAVKWAQSWHQQQAFTLCTQKERPDRTWDHPDDAELNNWDGHLSQQQSGEHGKGGQDRQGAEQEPEGGSA